jgi:hemin uptake protein HemP
MVEPIQQEAPARPAGESAKDTPAVIDLRTILQGKNEVWIEHAGVRYRLRVTRRNRLILQK